MPNISYPSNMSTPGPYMTQAQAIALAERQRQIEQAQRTMAGGVYGGAANSPMMTGGGEEAPPAEPGPNVPPLGRNPYETGRSFGGAAGIAAGTEPGPDLSHVFEKAPPGYKPFAWLYGAPSDKEGDRSLEGYQHDPTYGGRVAPGVPSAATEQPQDITPPQQQIEPQPTGLAAGVAANLAQLNGLFPQQNYAQTPSELALDADMAKDRERTRLLASLALSAGIASAGGGPWESVGRGLTAAGGVYDDGFARYQKALEGKARREMSRRESEYKDNFDRTKMAVDMHQDSVKNEQDRRSQLMKEALEFTKFGLNSVPKDEDFTSDEQKAANQAKRDWWVEEYRRTQLGLPSRINVAD